MSGRLRRALALLAVPALVLLPITPASASAPPPAAPTITSVTPGDGQLTVAFIRPADVCPGCTVVVEASTSTSHTDIVASASGAASPLTITGLTNGTPYVVRAWVRSLEGGTVTEFVGDGTIGGAGIRYRVHTFTTVGSTTLTVDRNLDVELLVVGGGGAGGASGGGGGGAGGYVSGGMTLLEGTPTVTVGAGGLPENLYDGANSGQASVLAGLTAQGGGGGANMCNDDYPCPAGRAGGSGGGGSRVRNVDDASGTLGGAATQTAPQAGTEGFGNAGGRGRGIGGADTQGGGGGGAGGAGTQAETTNTAGDGGNGGAGRASTISGASVFYAGGGGGGVGSDFSRAGIGGTGGGGDGAITVGVTTTAGSPGTPGTGGGGGGGSTRPAAGALGGAGGSGIVIVRHDFNVAVHPVAVAPGIVIETPTPAASAIALACSPSPALVVGATVRCTVTGGDPGIDVLWRASFNPVLAEAGVTLDGSGSGTFTFRVPAAAVGTELRVELVAWTAPVVLGVVGGPVPAGVSAGAVVTPLSVFLLLALVAAGGVLLIGRRVLH